jgi:NADH dehydrogenase
MAHLRTISLALAAMTVMVTGASGVLGHAAVAALLARDEVRATVRRSAAAEPLRALGAKVAVLDPRRADELAEVLPRCHTLVHLIGGVRQPDAAELFWANHGSVEVALEAAREAGTKRFVLVSVPGADPEATHPFLRAKGMAEAAVTASGIDHAIVRSTHAFGLGGLWFTAVVQGATVSPPFVCGPGSQPVAPVFATDVAAVVTAIDDHTGPLAGTWALEGPDALTADELVALLRGDDTVPAHADGQPAAAALTTLLETPIDAVTASFFAMPSRADRPDAAEAFGVRPTGLVDGLRATLAAAATSDGG